MMSQRKGRHLFTGLVVCWVILIIVTVATAAEEINVGVIGPMKFTIGEEQWVASTLAAEEINAAGGVRVGNKQYKLNLIKGDTNEILNLTDAISTMERLITVNKVQFIVGGYRTEAVLAMQDVMAKYKIIWLNAYTGSPEPPKRLVKDYDKYKYYFKVCTVNSYHLSKIYMNTALMAADKVKEKLGIEKPRVAIFVEKVIWADPIVEAAKKLFPELGMEVVGIWRPSPTASDVTSDLTSIKNSGAHIIFFVSAGPVGVPVSKQWGELQVPAALVGSNVMTRTDRQWETTGGLCNYEVSGNLFGEAAVTPTTIPFIKKMKKRYGYTPTNSAILYDTVYVLKDALERAGTLDTDTVITSLEKTSYLGTSGRIAFTPKDDPKWPHDVIFGPNYSHGVVTQWRDGKQLVVWPDGKPLSGDKSWVGLKYDGTVDIELPPWMVKYWKGKK
jgi:branched-chain amino acid transport system substrate-binding protein